MSRYHSYLNTAKSILDTYKGEEPFASFLKKYFAANKKYGSKDRKQISHLCYCYFRLGKAAESLPVEERILAALFLCSNTTNEILENLQPAWSNHYHLPLKEKLAMLNYSFLIKEIFPWKEELCEGMDHDEFFESFLTQPDLFIRIRPHHAEPVFLKLNAAGVEYEFISPFTIRLPNSFKTDQYFEPEKEVVVQDYSSQQIAHLIPANHNKPVKVWDCCAASGGKSILVYDLNPHIELTVSDVRESILANLKKRFNAAGIAKYNSYVIDLTKGKIPSVISNQQSLIIADVPCTGSGTWGRTPEQLFFLKKENIEKYARLQKEIASKVIPYLATGGYFLYITCSVFKKENEENADFIKNQFKLELMKMELIKGYDKKADTMFAALFRKKEK